ncbi:MAG TPA: Gfo/Idh/MocA family oxidoreductase [Isosphaeraceae bacterium]|jgi:predicted dehydrogenase|nr:Gfo/Idh/MocA family oxidoreductase [Isosphaeraceae bacterium]
MAERDGDLGIVVVGVGSFGARRAAAIVAARGCRLAGVVDRDRDVADAVARRLGTAAIDDLDDAMADPKAGAVVVATPHADHAELARRALAAGKHVLCEKPLTIAPAEARALVARAAAARLRLATGLNHRFYPPIAAALDLARRGAIGPIVSVRAQIGHRAPADFLRSWHADSERSGGGTLIDNGPHACDLIRLLLGEVVAAQGVLRHGAAGPVCESEAFALLRTADGRVAELRSSWELEAGYLTLDVRGAAGFLRVETAPWGLSGVLADGRRLRRRYIQERVHERIGRLRSGCEGSLIAEVESFAMPSTDARGGDGLDGLRAAEMVAAVYEAARSGREVVLAPPPKPVATPRTAGKEAA